MLDPAPPSPRAGHTEGSHTEFRPPRLMLVLLSLFLLPFAGVGLFLALGGVGRLFEWGGGHVPFRGAPSGLATWLPWLPRLFGFGMLAFVGVVLYGIWTERRARYVLPADLDRRVGFGATAPPPPPPAWQAFTRLIDCDYCGGKKQGWPERCPGCGAP